MPSRVRVFLADPHNNTCWIGGERAKTRIKEYYATVDPKPPNNFFRGMPRWKKFIEMVKLVQADPKYRTYGIQAKAIREDRSQKGFSVCRDMQRKLIEARPMERPVPHFPDNFWGQPIQNIGWHVQLPPRPATTGTLRVNRIVRYRGVDD